MGAESEEPGSRSGRRGGCGGFGGAGGCGVGLSGRDDAWVQAGGTTEADLAHTHRGSAPARHPHYPPPPQCHDVVPPLLGVVMPTVAGRPSHTHRRSACPLHHASHAYYSWRSMVRDLLAWHRVHLHDRVTLTYGRRTARPGH
jgi:hypothetical protein